jgi:predicted HicB family RNase H-like nuclease
MTYKGYSGVIEVDLEAGELFGRTVGMRDIITFQGTTVEEVRKSVEESVDFYLSCCEEENRIPDRPYSGRFNVRISPEVHRQLAILAESRGQSLNNLVSAALADVARETPSEAQASEPTWQEVKAELDTRYPQAKRLSQVKRSPSSSKSKSRSSRNSAAPGRRRSP